jgi:hypothetical protein
MTFTPADYLARAEAVDPETASMLRQAARDAAEVERLRGNLQVMHRRAQRSEGKNTRTQSLLASVSGFLHRKPEGPVISMWWLKSYVDAAMQHARAGSNKAFTMHYHYFGERQRKLDIENRELRQRAEAAEAKIEAYRVADARIIAKIADDAVHWKSRAEAAEARLARDPQESKP